MARLRLPDEVYEEIKEQIVALFTDYDIKCTPISAFEVATKLGLTVWPYSALGRKRRRAAGGTSFSVPAPPPGAGRSHRTEFERCRS